MKIPDWLKGLIPTYILMLVIVIVVVLLVNYNQLETKGIESDYRGMVSGVITFAQFDDGAGSDWYWQNDLVINGSWWHFAVPCYGLMQCHLNQSYTIKYEPYRQLSGDGHWYYWIGQIKEIYDSSGNSLWKFSEEPKPCVYGHWEMS